MRLKKENTTKQNPTYLTKLCPTSLYATITLSLQHNYLTAPL